MGQAKKVFISEEYGYRQWYWEGQDPEGIWAKRGCVCCLTPVDTLFPGAKEVDAELLASLTDEDMSHYVHLHENEDSYMKRLPSLEVVEVAPFKDCNEGDESLCEGCPTFERPLPF